MLKRVLIPTSRTRASDRTKRVFRRPDGDAGRTAVGGREETLGTDWSAGGWASVCGGGVPPGKVSMRIAEPDCEALRSSEDGVFLSNGRVVEGIMEEDEEAMLGEDGVKPSESGDEAGSTGVL